MTGGGEVGIDLFGVGHVRDLKYSDSGPWSIQKRVVLP